MEGLDGAVGTDAQTQPLCTHSGSGLGDRVLGEEKRIVLYLCLQRGPQWACASPNCVPCCGGSVGNCTAVVKGGR